MRRIIVAAALALGPLLPVEEVAAQPTGPAVASAPATLSIITGVVERVPAGGALPEAAADSMSLAVGDRILTGPNAQALITFLDGSTLLIGPGSDVAIKRLEVAGRGRGSDIGIHINFGTVWARVVRLLDPFSAFSLESNAGTASSPAGFGLPAATPPPAGVAAAPVLETPGPSLMGCRVHPDGSLDCWAEDGWLIVKDAEGRSVLLGSDEATTIRSGEQPTRRPLAEDELVRDVAEAPDLPLPTETPGTAADGGSTENGPSELEPEPPVGE